MRYYKQFHTWPYVHLITLMIGIACLVMMFVFDDPAAKVPLLVCGIFAFIITLTLKLGRSHYIEISRDWIEHQGFTQWKIRRADVVRVEAGKKGWTDDYDPFLKVHATGCAYNVDSGFLINKQRIEELTRVIQEV